MNDGVEMGKNGNLFTHFFLWFYEIVADFYNMRRSVTLHFLLMVPVVQYESAALVQTSLWEISSSVRGAVAKKKD